MKQIISHTLSVLTKKEKKRFGLLIVMDICISIADILSLAALLWIIQFYIQPGRNNAASFLPAWLPGGNPVWIIAIFLLLFAVKNTAAYFVSRSHFKFISGVAVRISHNNLVSYQQAPFADFVNIDSSTQVRNICYRPFEFCQHRLTGIQQVITQLSLMLVTVIAICIFNAKLFLLLLLILLPPVILVFWFIKKKMSAARKDIQHNNERSFQYLFDALKGWVEGNIYNRNPFFVKRFIQARQNFSSALFNSLALQTLPARIIEVFAVLGLLLLSAIAQWTGNSSDMLITIGAFMAAAYKIIPGIVKMINASGQIKAYEFSLQDMFHPGSIDEERASAKLVKTINSIALKNVDFAFETRPILQNFSMTVQPGDFVGICGESGKGKTTLVNLILGFLAPHAGSVCINGSPVSPAEIKDHWPAIAYVRQQGFFIYDTVEKNITLEEEVQDAGQLQESLRVSDINKLVAAFPEGTRKMITENGKNISGGQQQRIALARALYKNAPLILLDEPFNELDDEATLGMLEHFRQLAAAGRMVLMITHDKKSLSFCNKIISLDEQ